MNAILSLAMDWEPLASRIVFTLAHSIWQASGIAFLLFLSTQLFRKRSRLARPLKSTTRYVFSCAALALVPVCSTATFVSLQAPTKASIDSTEVKATSNTLARSLQQPTTLSSSPTPTVMPDAQAYAPAQTPRSDPKTEVEAAAEAVPESTFPGRQNWSLQTWAPTILLAYFLTSAALLTRIFGGMYRCHLLKKSCSASVDLKIRKQFDVQVKRMGMKVQPLLLTSEQIMIPAVIGVLQPVVVLPAALLTNLNSTQISAIMVHELAHIKRLDPVINCLQRILEAIFFFNPACWYISKQIHIERENCCDDTGASLFGPSRYADALLSMAGVCLIQRRVSTATLSALGSQGLTGLSYRIERLLGTPAGGEISISKTVLLLCFATCLFLCGAGLAAAMTSETAPQENNQDQNDKPEIVRSDDVATDLQSHPKNSNVDSPKMPDEIVWAEEQDSGWQTGVKITEAITQDGRQLKLKYFLRNTLAQQRTVSVAFDSGPCKLRLDDTTLDTFGGATIGSSHLIRDFTIDPNASKSDELCVQAFDLTGLAAGKYTLRLNSYFSIPSKSNQGVRTGVPCRIQLPLRIPSAESGNIKQELENSRIDPSGADIFWGKPSNGLRLGAKIIGDRPTKFEYGDTARVRLYIQNVSAEPKKTGLQLPHPADSWSLNIEDSKHRNVRSNQVFVSYFSPLRVFFADLQPGKVHPLSGEKSPFREGGQEEGYPSRIEDVSFLISQASPGEQMMPPFSYALGNGKHSAYVFATFQFPDAPGLTLQLETGLVPFSVGNSKPKTSGATLSGKIRLDRDLTYQPTIRVLPNGDPTIDHKPTAIEETAAEKALQTIADPSLVVGRNRGLANVFIWVAKTPENYQGKLAAPPRSVRLTDFKTFRPRAQIVPVNQELSFRNEHSHRTNIRLEPYKSQAHNFVLPPGGSRVIPNIFTAAEFPVDVRSDVLGKHVTCWLLPVEHNLAAVTDENGEFSISDLPPGRHHLKLWHERIGSLSDEFVEVASRDPEPLLVEVSADKFPNPNDKLDPKQNNYPHLEERSRWFAVGKVTDTDGRPMADVNVHVHSGIGTLMGGGRGITNSSGRYRIQFTPGVMMSGDSSQLQYANVSVHKAGWAEQNLNRHGAGAMAIRPVAEEDLKTFGVSENNLALPQKPRQTDFIMAPAVRIEGRLLGNGSFPQITPRAARHAKRKGQFATLESVAHDRTPLSGWQVYLSGPNLPPASSVLSSATTDENGKFVFASVPRGFQWNFSTGTVLKNSHDEVVSRTFEIGLLDERAKLNVDLVLENEQTELNANIN